MRRLLDIFIIPLILGVLFIIIQFAVQLSSNKKEVSYEIDGPTPFINSKISKNVKVEINNMLVNGLYGYKVIILNSGTLPVEEMPVKFIFENSADNFFIFSINYNTYPKHEFGEIDKLDSLQNSIRMSYELLNPGDKVEVSFLANDSLNLTVYGKAKGLKLKEIDPSSKSKFNYMIGLIIVVFSSLFTLIIRNLMRSSFYKKCLNLI